MMYVCQLSAAADEKKAVKANTDLQEGREGMRVFFVYLN